MLHSCTATLRTYAGHIMSLMDQTFSPGKRVWALMLRDTVGERISMCCREYQECCVVNGSWCFCTV